MSIAFETAKYEFTYGDRIRRAIEASGHSVQSIAAELQVDRSTVSNWMHDRNRPRKRDLTALADLTGFDIGWIENGKVPSPSGDGTPVLQLARPEGLEPPTFWSGTSQLKRAA